jgi:hypothetical protein
MPAIFISSTFLDLGSMRADLRAWLESVFGAELVVMETFGSDATPPDVTSVRRVRECDVFIGIYARRYGTIDEHSGKSITEMELDEADRAYSAGVIKDVLLYVADDEMVLPESESDESSQLRLKVLRQRVHQHTCTSFKDRDELLLAVLRDVYNRFSQTAMAPALRVRSIALPPATAPLRPVGMEFLSSQYRGYLVGRDTKIQELADRVAQERIVLLLGDSGSGKTSLIHAGLIPELQSRNWRTIYTRPFGFPASDIVYQIQSDMFASRPLYRGPILPLLAEVRAVLQTSDILLVIDQFEDILSARDTVESEKLVSELRALNAGPPADCHVLISYRADLEGRLGSYWQDISGSSRGLARVYLGGVGIDSAWNGIVKTLRDLHIPIRISKADCARMREALKKSSSSLAVDGVYPPYLQMLVDHIWRIGKDRAKPYSMADYQTAGGIDGIIGGFLSRQLEYAQDRAGHVKLALAALVRSYGIKAQRTLAEVAADTRLSVPETEVALEKLIDLRLVRHLGENYEISHDFIAHRIADELIDSEEREFKRFRELLSSKAAAYRTTQALLTSEELLSLFKYRRRIILSEPEVELVFASWVQDVGPGLFWLLNPEHISQVRQLIQSAQAGQDLEDDQRASLILLRRRLDDTPLSDSDLEAFRAYKRSIELASLISEDPKAVPTTLLLAALRHRRDEVRAAATDGLAHRLAQGEWDILERLRKSTSFQNQSAYERMIVRSDVPVPEISITTPALREFCILKQIAQGSLPEGRGIRELRSGRVRARTLLFARALVRWRKGGADGFMKFAMKLSSARTKVALGAIPTEVNINDFRVLLQTYELLNPRERERFNHFAFYEKANALAIAIRSATRESNLPALRATVGRIRLTASARTLILALLEQGELKDLVLVLTRVAQEPDKIDFWNHTELGRAVAQRMETLGGGLPALLKRLLEKRELWEYLMPPERRTSKKSDLLALKTVDNRSLYIRLVAYGAIGCADEQDAAHLERLGLHYFQLVGRAAALRLVRLFGESAIQRLADHIDESHEKRQAQLLADALRYAEIEFYRCAKLW